MEHLLNLLKMRLGTNYNGLFDDESLAMADLQATSCEVDALIGLRYILPLNSVSGQNLRDSIVISLAEELAWSRSNANDIPAHAKARAEQMRKILRDISQGVIKIPYEQSSEEVQESGVIISGDAPQFTTDKMKGF